MINYSKLRSSRVMATKTRGTSLVQMHMWLEPDTAEYLDNALPQGDYSNNRGGGRRSQFMELSLRIFAPLIQGDEKKLLEGIEYLAHHVDSNTREATLNDIARLLHVVTERLNELDYELEQEESIG